MGDGWRRALLSQSIFFITILAASSSKTQPTKQELGKLDGDKECASGTSIIMDIRTSSLRNGGRMFSIEIWETAPSRMKPKSGDYFRLSHAGARVVPSSISIAMVFWILW